MKHSRNLTLFVLCTALLSCRQPAKETDKHPGSNEQLSSTPAVIAPNHAVIIGEVVEIESATFDPPDVDSPCSRFPCVAKVRVVSVVGTGMAFPQPFMEGEIYRMKFAYTLNPTDNVMPEMKPGLPGLQSGSRFKADLAGHETLEGDTQPRYTVHSYERQ